MYDDVVPTGVGGGVVQRVALVQSQGDLQFVKQFLSGAFAL